MQTEEQVRQAQLRRPKGAPPVNPVHQGVLLRLELERAAVVACGISVGCRARASRESTVRVIAEGELLSSFAAKIGRVAAGGYVYGASVMLLVSFEGVA